MLFHFYLSVGMSGPPILFGLMSYQKYFRVFMEQSFQCMNPLYIISVKFLFSMVVVANSIDELLKAIFMVIAN